MKEILVFGHWVELSHPTKMGTLRVEKSRGEELFSFEYDHLWIEKGGGNN